MPPGRLFVVFVAAFALLPEGAAVAEAVDQVPLLIVVYDVGGAIITEISRHKLQKFYCLFLVHKNTLLL